MLGTGFYETPVRYDDAVAPLHGSMGGLTLPRSPEFNAALARLIPGQRHHGCTSE